MTTDKTYGHELGLLLLYWGARVECVQGAAGHDTMVQCKVTPGATLRLGPYYYGENGADTCVSHVLCYIQNPQRLMYSVFPLSLAPQEAP